MPSIDLMIADEALIVRLSGRLVCPHCETAYHVVNQPPQKPGVCDRDGTIGWCVGLMMIRPLCVGVSRFIIR